MSISDALIIVATIYFCGIAIPGMIRYFLSGR